MEKSGLFLLLAWGDKGGSKRVESDKGEVKGKGRGKES